MDFLKKKTKKVKHVCEGCEKVSYHSVGDNIKNSLLTMILFIGMLTVLVLLVLGPVNMFGSLSSGVMFKMAGFQSDFDARAYALNYTDLDGRDSFIFAEELVANMPRVRYVPASFFKPLPKYEDMVNYGADCKGVSTLFVRMMQETGYQARIDCNNAQQHCVARIFYDGSDQAMYDRYMIVDLTGDYVAIYDNDKDFWKEEQAYMSRIYSK